LVVGERREGLQQLRVIGLTDPNSGHDLVFDEPAYMAFLSTNPSYDTSTVRFYYSSLTTPGSTFDYDMNERVKTLQKREEILGGFDSANYVSERWSATARDGTAVPVSIVYRRDLDRSKPNPLYLYAYGSYGSSMDPYFSSSRLSLLDRGFIFAMAHIRGGQELGRGWYEDGKLLKKMNTFTDFIDCAQTLIDKGYTTTSSLFAAGGSAGGLLMGGVLNMKPEIFRGIVAHVPFVDVVTTMLDESIPLTTFEYDEWGNPNDKVYYDYILSYSPYDNVVARAYPNILVTTGLHDSQVQYWEPAKWVAKLRTKKTGDSQLLFHVNMEAGHGGASGRFRRFREYALEYAFILDLVGRAPRQ
jgi:oligopeptidase B